MSGMQTKREDQVYQLKVTLGGSKPPIWRRLQVKDSTRLGDLHVILQVAMGWTDSHLHQFILRGEYFGAPDFDDSGEMTDEDKTALRDLGLSEKSRFVYEYDFGDGWQHAILVEKILPVERGVRYPVCLAGKLARPPEDCGGIWGFYNLLGIVADPKHPEHEEMREWLGGGFDPQAFDLDAVNTRLAEVRKQPRTWRAIG